MAIWMDEPWVRAADGQEKQAGRVINGDGRRAFCLTGGVGGGLLTGYPASRVYLWRSFCNYRVWWRWIRAVVGIGIGLLSANLLV